MTAENPNTKKTYFKVFGYSFFRNHFILKLDDTKVKNIYDATVVCKSLLENSSKIFYFLEASRFLSGYAKKIRTQKQLAERVSPRFSHFRFYIVNHSIIFFLICLPALLFRPTTVPTRLLKRSSV